MMETIANTMCAMFIGHLNGGKYPMFSLFAFHPIIICVTYKLQNTNIGLRNNAKCCKCTLKASVKTHNLAAKESI